MDERRLHGFYTTRPFWAGDPIDSKSPDLLPNFTKFMSQVAFAYDTSSFRLQICKDGMLMLHVFELENEFVAFATNRPGPIEQLVNWWGRYLDYLNCLVFLLDSAAIEVDKLAYFELGEVTRRDAFRVHFESGLWKGENVAAQSISSFYQMGRFASTYGSNFPFDERIFGRHPFSKKVFDTLFANFAIAVSEYSVLKSLAEIAKSIAEYKIGNHDTSLVLSWFVCEAQILKKWRAFLDASNRDLSDGSKRISGDWRKILTGRDYPISVITNLLELADQVPFNSFERIDKVRGFRNKVVHRDAAFSCDHTHCHQAIELALNLTVTGTGLKVRPNYSLSVRS